MKTSKRLTQIPSSPIRKLAPYADQVKKKGLEIIHLNIGDPDIKSPVQMIKSLKQIKANPIPYVHSQGMDELIKAIVWYYKKIGFGFIKYEDIQITSGGSEAIVMALMAVADQGDEVIVFEPTYPNYFTYAAGIGVKLVPVKTEMKNGFHLPTVDKIVSQINAKTKAILMCSPNNPTGTVYSKKEVELLVGIAKKYRLFLISDEVYREFVYGEKTHISLCGFMNQIPQQVIILDSLSKRYSVCGLRLGALITLNKKLLEGVLKIAQGRLSVGYIDQKIAARLTRVTDAYFTKNIQEYQLRRDFIFKSLSSIKGVKIYKPEGAFYMIVTLPVQDSDHFCQWLLTDFVRDGKTLMLAPGSGFYIDRGAGKNEVRIAYVLDKKKLEEAVKILKEALFAYKKIF